ncbi:MAG: ATP-dependent protease ATPase subunit HslU [Spirochaetales bacterium]|jgi:ATP-dependent HslUV protease ATP-binding subunit HslU|nr:ATP-dependent protease ATPase subunit HslU [Spirochaetales bacterium]
MTQDLDNLSPREIVRELDKYIIGQEKAKKAVAIALRNRTRRQKLPKELRQEISPKNIIMIGPTGVGKTEIARRLSKLCKAPFLKVEATKFTEVGYVGRDVESIVRDLMSVSYAMVRAEMEEEIRSEAEKRTEEVLLDLLLPRPASKMEVKGGPSGPEEFPPQEVPAALPPNASPQDPQPASASDFTREKFRDMLRRGVLDDRLTEISVSQNAFPAIEIFSGSNMEEVGTDVMEAMSSMFGKRRKKRRVSIKEAKVILLAEESEKLLDSDKIAEQARNRAEEMGIIFIDEIDKIAVKEGRGGVDVSREGVQRDILPIVEGSTVNTKYGMIDTSHMLFIAAGAFTISKPSDLIPELQGRFPIRVELEALKAEDFERILTQPQNALTTQYAELLKIDGITLDFTLDGVKRISKIAAEVNSRTENIGARRLHTVMELLLEEVSFAGPDLAGQRVNIDEDYVNQRLADVIQDQDLSRYIL